MTDRTLLGRRIIWVEPDDPTAEAIHGTVTYVHVELDRGGSMAADASDRVGTDPRRLLLPVDRTELARVREQRDRALDLAGAVIEDLDEHDCSDAPDRRRALDRLRRSAANSDTTVHAPTTAPENR